MNTIETKKETYQRLSKLNGAKLSSDGKEINNPRPMVLTGPKRDNLKTILETIIEALRIEMLNRRFENQVETLQDSHDFNIKSEWE